MARFSEEDRGRRSGTCGRRGCPSNASPSIWAGRTPRCDRFIADHGGRRPTPRERSELRLSLAEREEISRGLAAGLSIRAIAGGLGAVAVDGLPGGERQRRPAVLPGLEGRPGGVPAGPAAQAGQALPVPAAAGAVERKLEAKWSPQQISAWLAGPTPTTRRCRCPTRPSTSPSSSRAVERCAKSCTRACGRGRAMRRAKAYTKGGVGQGQIKTW